MKKYLLFLLFFIFPAVSHALEIETKQVTLPTTSGVGWVSVQFTTPFSDVPVVIVSPGPSPGGEPFTIRIKDVTPMGFLAQTVEPTGPNGPTHLTVTVTYMAVERGIHGLPDGSVLIADVVNTQAQQFGMNFNLMSEWENVVFGVPYLDTPAIVAQVQTVENEENKKEKKKKNKIKIIYFQFL